MHGVTTKINFCLCVSPNIWQLITNVSLESDKCKVRHLVQKYLGKIAEAISEFSHYSFLDKGIPEF